MSRSWWSRIAIARSRRALALGCVGGAVLLVAALTDRPTSLDPAIAAPPGAAGVSLLHPFSAFDPGDDTTLMAAVTDVFVGTIVAEVSAVRLTTPWPEVKLPRTQFAVRVQRPIKGNAPRTVVVSQLGGIDASTGQFVNVAGDTLLKPGDRMLFITEYDRVDGWYHLIAAGFAHHRISDTRAENRLVGRCAAAVARSAAAPRSTAISAR